VADTYLLKSDLYSVLELVDSTYEKAYAPQGMTGVGGYRTLTF
jgi:hypothetical protein